MKLAVLTYAHAPNPFGFPTQYPAETREVDDEQIVDPPWVEMTQEELHALIDQYQEQVQAIAAAKESLPVEVPLWKFRASLKLVGLWEQVLTAVAALPDMKRIVVEEQLHAGETIHRHHPTVVSMASAIGLSESQVDDVFRLANSLA